MTICNKCVDQRNAHVSGPHSSLVRRGVIMRILDASETYDCLECGTGWERIQMAEDVRNVMYRWKVREGSSHPGYVIDHVTAMRGRCRLALSSAESPDTLQRNKT